MSTTLTEYEERGVLEIAHWKAHAPSWVARAFQVIRKPLNEVTGRVATGSKVRSLCVRVESLVEPKAGRDEIVRAAGVVRSRSWRIVRSRNVIGWPRR